MAEVLVSDLRGRLVWVPEDKRILYHAGLAHGANHLVTLVTQAMGLLRESGADDPAATLRPLLTAALDNALTMGDAALTGPIVRGDVETVRAHLEEIRRTSRARCRPTSRSARRPPTAPCSTAGCCRSGRPSWSASSTTPWRRSPREHPTTLLAPLTPPRGPRVSTPRRCSLRSHRRGDPA